MNYNDFITQENIKNFLQLHYNMDEEEFFKREDPERKRMQFIVLFKVFTNHQIPMEKNGKVESYYFINEEESMTMTRPDQPDFDTINSIDELVKIMRDYVQFRDHSIALILNESNTRKEKGKKNLKRTRKFQNKELGMEGEIEL